MDRTPSPNDPTQYLESLMHAGQQSIKQFDDALAAAMGVRGNNAAPRGQVFSPFAFAMDMQREYFTLFWRFWNAAFIAAISGGKRAAVQPERGDKRFKDDAWQETPFYDLLKQSYLLASTQLHELVDHAHVDDRTRLQLRFHARQFIDAMRSFKFPCHQSGSHTQGNRNSRGESFCWNPKSDRRYSEGADYEGRRIRI